MPGPVSGSVVPVHDFRPPPELLQPIGTTQSAQEESAAEREEISSCRESGTAQTGSQEEGAAAADAEPEDEPDEESAPGLAYRLLDTEAQAVYREMLSAIENHAEEAELSTLDESVLPRAFEALNSDHGEIFWINGYQYVKKILGDRITEIRFQPLYTMTLDERTEYQAQVDRNLDAFLYGTDENSSDYEKAKAVYENLAQNVQYNQDAAENQNILSVFLGGQSVCNGIAASAQYLLTCLDIPCMSVYGQAEGDNHAWNLAVLDGEPYLIDATWGINVSAALGTCSYEYLNLTSEDLAATHTVNMSFTIPECTAREDNYFVKEGLYFETFDEAAVGEILNRQQEQGGHMAALRFADAETYEQARQALIGEGGLSEYCPGITNYRYMENRELHVLTIEW